MVVLQIPTQAQVDFQLITEKVQNAVSENNWIDGLLVLFVPHTTCAVTINENADPDVVRDIKMEVNKVIPFNDGYHHSEGNSAAHIKTSMFGSSETILVENGRLILGTWQGIFLADFDGPRHRKLYLKFMATK